MSKYGINVVNFYVTSIDTPEEDTSVKKLKDALAKKAEMDIVGFNYTQERSFDTLEGAAKNESSIGSNIMGAGIGLGMGVNMGGMVTEQMKDVTKNISISNNEERRCSNCNAQLSGNQKFCSECGKPVDDICSNCGAILRKGQKFCPECGKSQIVICKKCNKEIEKGEKFCSNCGEKVEN